MARKVFLSLREHGDALRAAGLELGDDILDACESADNFDACESELEDIAALLDAGKAATTTGGVLAFIEAKVGKDRGEYAAMEKRVKLADATIATLRRAMVAAGVAPPPPVERLAPSPPSYYQIAGQDPLDEDDIPF